MKRIFALLALCFLAGSAAASDFIRATIVLTNVPVSADALTNNSAVRVWTNVNTASFILTNSVGIKESATNLYNHISKSSFGGTPGIPLQSLSWSNATSIVLKADAPLVLGIRGPWGYVTYSTNLITTNVTYLSAPIDRLDPSIRTNNASDMLYAVGKYPTNQIPTTSPPFTNFLNKGSGSQSVTGLVTFIGGIQSTGGVANGLRGTNLIGLNGTVDTLTNGSYITPRITSPVTANLTNTGLAISSPNTNYSGSEQFGTGATVNTNGGTALGQSSAVSGYQGTAVGNSATVSSGGYQGTASGTGTEVTAYRGAAFGAFSSVDGSNGVAVGTSAQAPFDESAAFGTGVTTTETNQYKIGAAIHLVQVDGRFQANLTNSVYKGTNQWHGSIQYPRAAAGAVRTGLANTNNYLDAATNGVIYVSGATTLHNFTGMKGGQDGQRVTVRDGSGTDIEIFNLDGSVAAADRIWTGTGSKATRTNRPAYFDLLYNSQSNWWEIVTSQ